MVTLAEIHAEEDLFFALMGRCIGVWARIEVNLFKLFGVALGAPESLCGVIFWAIPSFGMRLSYTSSLVVECLSDPSAALSKQHKTEIEKWWDALRKQLTDGYEFRNRLAHQHIPTTSMHVEQQPDGTQMGVIVLGKVDKVFANPLDRKQKFDPIKREDMLTAHNKIEGLWADLESFTASFYQERQKRF